MKRNRIPFWFLWITLLMIISSVRNICYGQIDNNSYVIITFEHSFDSEDYYYFWVLPCQEETNVRIYPYSFCTTEDPYSRPLCKTELEDDFLQGIHYPTDESIPVLDGGSINNLNGLPWSAVVQDYNNDADFTSQLLGTVMRHRKEIQRITKKWKRRRLLGCFGEEYGRKETIRVYYTPVQGKMALGWEYGFDHNQLLFAGYAYYAQSEVSYNKDFNESSFYKMLEMMDFSCIDYYGHSYTYSSNAPIREITARECNAE